MQQAASLMTCGIISSTHDARLGMQSMSANQQHDQENRSITGQTLYQNRAQTLPSLHAEAGQTGTTNRHMGASKYNNLLVAKQQQNALIYWYRFAGAEYHKGTQVVHLALNQAIHCPEDGVEV